MANDDELNLSTSGTDYFTKSDKGKREALRRKVQQERGKHVDEKKVSLQSDLNLKQLRSDVEGKKDTTTKKERDADAKKHETFGTKTHKQEEDAAILEAQDKQQAEQLIQETQRQQQAQAQSKEEYQQDAG